MNISHSVFTDLPPKIPSDISVPDEIKKKRCFGRNCSIYAFGGPHRCPIGRCQCAEDAIIKWLNE